VAGCVEPVTRMLDRMRKRAETARHRLGAIDRERADLLTR
jgi:hypothetical protein